MECTLHDLGYIGHQAKELNERFDAQKENGTIYFRDYITIFGEYGTELITNIYEEIKNDLQ